MAGQVLSGRYRIDAPLGRGGMATTYRVHDLLDQRDLALKLLGTRMLDAELVAEFERLRGLVHPHLTHVHDFGRAQLDGELCAYYTAELVEGGTLALRAEKHGFDAALPCLLDALDALTFLHSLGLRHGDFKPDNVLCTQGGAGVLIDLGCASPLLGKADAVSGTPAFMAPELLAGEPADERADLYAVGVTLRELGGPPRLSGLVEQLTQSKVSARPPSVLDVMSALGRAPLHVFARRAPVVHMVGRSRELNAATEAFSPFLASEHGPRVLSVHGAPGVGRSRFLRELVWQYQALVAVHEVRASEAGCLRHSLVRASGQPLAAGIEGLLSAALGLARGRAKVLLAIDDADRLDAEGALELSALLRVMNDQGNLALLLSSRHALPLEPTAVSIALHPLDRPALSEWAGKSLADYDVDGLLAYTGGYARYVSEALNALSAGRLRGSELAQHRSSAAQAHASGLTQLLQELEPGALDALIQLALWAQATDAPSLTVSRFDAAQLAYLSGLELVRVEGQTVALARGAERDLILACAPKKRVARARLGLISELSPRSEAWAIAARLLQLLEADRAGEADTLFTEQLSRAHANPRCFLPFVRASLDRFSPELCLQASKVARLCAEPKLSLSLLARARRRTRSGRALLSLRQEAVEAYLSLGRKHLAERGSRALIDASRSDPACAELRSRALLKVGAFDAAVALASSALANAHDDELRARLLETQAAGEAYLGEHALSLAHIDEAARLFEGHSSRAQARCLAFRCFVAYRAGDTEHAAQSAERVRELSERHGFDDLLVNALTNLGSAREMQGAWGLAIDSYERALALAVALGREGSVRSLRANLANLSIEVGLFERAEELLSVLERDRSLSAAQRHSVRLYRAELLLLQGKVEEAVVDLNLLLEELVSLGAQREHATALSLRALGHAELDHKELARADIEAAFRAAQALGSADIAAWVCAMLARAALRISEGQAQAARVEDQLKRASEAGLSAFVASLHTVLSQIYEGAKAQALSREHRERALLLWERMALDLPHSTRDLFWQHPFRAMLRSDERKVERPEGRATLNLKRVFELNRRLNSALSVKAVLDYAIDAATEITSAERGFVLLSSDAQADFEVAVARNLDRRRLLGEELKLSRSIAEGVIRDDEPVLTLDAGSDTRFAAQASVHAMRLKSVLCVPIRSPRGVLGALYLDTRIQRARFERVDLELLMAFADQVAVALTNARLVSELEQRTRELSREKQRVEALSEGQAREIERLAEELDKRNEALELRYDYSQIVGRSEAMRRVFSVLDRVLDSELSVLIQGESGTGKELVARAIHFNSDRKSKPFLGLNCAALPESLIESELFGVTKGAFTGADRDRPGLFLSAQGGTLFLDELQELPLSTQAKLLRVLQERKVRAVGGTRAMDFDVRILCASNRDLMQRVRDGLFREDLYYRIAVVELSLPALRERAEDILPIAEALLKRRGTESGQPKKRLSPDAVRALLAYGFPGNVRELENILLRASVMAEGPTISAQDLGLNPKEIKPRERSRSRKDYEKHEAERLLSQLEAERWNVSRVAKNLGLPRNTLYRKLARYGIARDP